MAENVKLTGNKLIAEFMGLSKIREGWTTDHTKPMTSLNEIIHAEMEDHTWYVDWLRFDESWDWLMPVVEKIEDLETYRFDITIRQGTITIFDKQTITELFYLEGNSKIATVYKAVVEFIKWYNKNK